MKGTIRISRTSLLAVTAALTLTIGCQANPVTNPGFENPLNPAWTVEYVFGGPSDFEIADRTTVSERTGDYGAHFRNVHDGTMHAYFKQTVSGLAPGAAYSVKAWMKHMWDRTDKYDVYVEALGGGPARRTPTSTTAYAEYTLTQTANSLGRVEIRLHFNKFSNTVDFKIADGYFDDVSMTLIPEPSGFAALLAGIAGLGSALRRRR